MNQNAQILFRGIRSWSKDGSEEVQLLALNTWGPILYGPLKWPLPTIFLEGDPRYTHISSTLIRDICQQGRRNPSPHGKQRKEQEQEDTAMEALSRLVPKEVARDVMLAYSRNST